MTVPGVFPPGARIMFVGQAPAAEEVYYGRPFVGAAGRELNRWLFAAKVRRRHVAITNVFNEPIPAEGMSALYTKERNGLPPIASGRWLIQSWHHHLARLRSEIEAHAPNIIVGLGGEALWALRGALGIDKCRGSVFSSLQGPKALCTFHPAYILRGGYKHRRTAIADLLKAVRESDTPDIRYRHRTLWIEPTLEDIRLFRDRYLWTAKLIAVDIETAKRRITHISFAPSRSLGISIPFVDEKGGSYWKTAEEEAEAWRLVRDICASPARKLLQNGLYDAVWLWTQWGIPLVNYCEDTRLAHHALYPELPKGLRFMGAMWENEQDWKGLSRHAEDD